MPALEIRITSMYPPGAAGGTRAYASATIDGCFGVRGIKIVEGGKDGLFVSMPSRKTQDDTAVLDAYHQALTMAQTAPAPQAQPEAPKAGQQMSGM